MTDNKDLSDELIDGAVPEGTVLVLVVDDEDAFRFEIKRYLQGMSHLEIRPFFVRDGRHALRFCQARMPDLILQDYSLPDMTGVEVLHALRELKDGKKPAVVVLTGQGDEEIATLAMKMGATDYLRKDGLDQETLSEAMDKALRRHRTQLLAEEQGQRLKRYESLLDAIDDAIFIIDADTAAPLEMNRRAREVLSVSDQHDSILGIGPFPADKAEWWHYLEGLRERNVVSREGMMQFGDKQVPVDIRERLVWHQDNHYIVAVARDISRFKALESELEELSVRDSLTGLANRREFDKMLRHEWSRGLRDKPPTGTGLLMIDVDHFKDYNDSLGHIPGDNCLIRIANMLRQCVARDTDLVARYGGEEFAVILHASDSKGCLRVAERIQARLANAALPHPKSPHGKQVTLSIGCAALNPGDEACRDMLPTDLVWLADRALYEAKRQGRNRVVMSDPDDLAEREATN